MANAWYRWLHRVCVEVYFDRASFVAAAELPSDGPLLVLGLHRNGAVDGFVYHRFFPEAQFLISRQLRRTLFGRLFFDGIEVARPKDRDTAESEENYVALEECVEHLRQHGTLFVFPEGTSSLGPKHLPFKSGAAQLIARFLETNQRLTVLPVGIHYLRPWAFRSRVVVVTGRPILFNRNETGSAWSQRKELKRAIQTGLEEVGINVTTVEELERIELWAHLQSVLRARQHSPSLGGRWNGTRAESRSPWGADYFSALKHGEKSGAPAIELIRSVWLRERAVVFPSQNPSVAWGGLLLTAPIVLLALAINAPAVLAAYWAGRRLADDRNVIALWRILVGIPLLLIQLIFVLSLGAVTNAWTMVFGYLLLSAAGLKLYPCAKALALGICDAARAAAGNATRNWRGPDRSTADRSAFYSGQECPD